MMEQAITNWQKTWSMEKASELKIDELVSKLNGIQKKDSTKHLVMLISLPFTIAMPLFIISFFENIYFALAVLFIGAGIVLIIVQAYRSRFGAVKNEYLLDNKTHIRKYVSKLKSKIVLTSKYMWV